MDRVSLATSGAGGNADAFDASILCSTNHQSHPALSDDGSVVFTTAEPLSPLDGNGEPDAYSGGRTRLPDQHRVGGRRR